jgi:subtilisin family serine protease
MKGLISNLPQVEVVKVLRSKKVISTFSARPDEANEAYVVKMDRNQGELLKQSAPPHLIVEQDRFLDYGGMVSPRAKEAPVRPLRSTKGMRSVPVKFRIVGEGDAPLPNAKVTLQGDAFAQDGTTDKNGEITLTLHSTGDNPARSLFIDPVKDYWDRYIITPDISLTEVNTVRMISLKQQLRGFPESYKHGWGQQLMGLDQIPAGCTGKGVKIAIIDSGADCEHPVLRHIQRGKDMTNNGDESSWKEDVVGHGTHCAGVITGRCSEQIGLCGFAPEAEIHIFKIFPGGQFSSLLDALDECMALDIDIINMSLGSDQPSQAVEQKLEEAVHDGIACIVAAGNSGGPVQYPACSPNVLAVSAIGRLKEFPSESWDARTVIQDQMAPDGVFSPSFTCFGQQVAVCAPGVSIVSSVPDEGFEPQSGTSMAAPHVTGFAALLLAHHSMFQGPLGKRGPQRVAALFNLIRSSCASYPFAGGRAGAGVPRLHGLVQALTANRGAAATEAAPGQTTGAAAPQPGNGSGAHVETPAATPLGCPPGIDPQAWQTIILPQLLALLANQGAFGPLAPFGMQGLMPQFSNPLAPLIANLLAQSQGWSQGGSVSTLQAAPGMMPGQQVQVSEVPPSAALGSSGQRFR